MAMPWPPTAGQTWAASPARSARPTRMRAAMRRWKRARLSQSASLSVTGAPPIMAPISRSISASVGADVRSGSSMVLKQ